MPPARAPLLGRGRADDRDRRAAEAGVASAAAADVVSTPVAPDADGAAFFDLDNTVMIGASMFHFARGLATRKVFSAGDIRRYAWQQVKFRVQGREDHAHISQAKDAALAFVAGQPVARMVAVCEQIYDEQMADRLWAGTIALAHQHIEAGRRVWLVTATPVELARIVAHRLGLTGALGTVSETQHGVYTGRLVGEPLHGPAKAAAVAALAAREHLDLGRCSAYSDSANDIPMLSLVGHPVAINPDRTLRAAARERGWEIRDFRATRRAARIAVPTALGIGTVAGGAAATVALARRSRGH